MLSDTLFRIVNIAGGLGLDDDLWRRQVLGPSPAAARRAARRRIADTAAEWCGDALERVEEPPRLRALGRLPG